MDICMYQDIKATILIDSKWMVKYIHHVSQVNINPQSDNGNQIYTMAIIRCLLHFLCHYYSITTLLLIYSEINTIKQYNYWGKTLNKNNLNVLLLLKFINIAHICAAYLMLLSGWGAGVLGYSARSGVWGPRVAVGVRRAASAAHVPKVPVHLWL